MSINFHPYIKDEETGRWRWMFLDTTKTGIEAFRLSLSEAYGLKLLDALGIHETISIDPLPIDIFEPIVENAINTQDGKTSPAIRVRKTQTSAHIQIPHGGRSKDYIDAKLRDLRDLVLRSKEIGATHFGWS